MGAWSVPVPGPGLSYGFSAVEQRREIFESPDTGTEEHSSQHCHESRRY